MTKSIIAGVLPLRHMVFLLTALVLAGCLGGIQLGGTISGLSADGLVLANGLNTVRPPANATSFVFPDLLNRGMSYNITVKTQPSGLYCSVANGAGVMGATAVTNVAVTCLPAPFQKLVGIAADAVGNLYVADAGNNNVSKIAPDNSVSLVSTLPVASGSLLQGITADPAGSLYAYDVSTNVSNVSSIHKITLSGAVTTVTIGWNVGGITMDSTGNLYETAPVVNCVAVPVEYSRIGLPWCAISSSSVVKVTPEGISTTLVGGFGYTWQSIVSDAAGNLYVAGTEYDPLGYRTGSVAKTSIQKITPDGVVTTLADGIVDTFYSNTNLAIDGSNNLYAIGGLGTVPASILKITPAGVVTTIADFNGTAPIKLPAVPVAIVFVAPNTLAVASAKSVFRVTLP